MSTRIIPVPGLSLRARSAIAVPLLCFSPAFAQPTFIPIANVPGATAGSLVTSLSADGTAVTGEAYPAGLVSSTFRWTLGGGTQNLGNPAGGNNSFGRGISGDGSVIAGTEFGTGGIGARAFRWTSGGGFQSIGSLAGGPTGAVAYGVSADGSGISGTDGSLGGLQAFRWTSGGGMQNLGVLPGGSGSEGFGINADASVVVGTSDLAAEAGARAFRWTSGGGMQNLGLLPGASESFARAVSGDGTAVTGLSGLPSAGQAFRWTEGAGMQGIGILPGRIFSEGYAVNGDGSVIVGWSGLQFGDAPSSTAFLWSASTGMVDLNTYLPTLGVNLTGWTLNLASGVSSDGRTIAGNGIFNGQNRGWVVTNIPAPGAATLLGLGGFFALRRRR